tara:strand:- start:12275 stop:12694 length:420 start_codon:yes stop_codon:yes gene_type:complete
MTAIEIGCQVYGHTQNGHRDAFHSACVVVRSKDKLKPGTRVCFDDDTKTKVSAVDDQDTSPYDGITDPFLTAHTNPNYSFNMMLKPGMVKNLTHYFAILGETEDQAKRASCIGEYATKMTPEPEEEPEDYGDDECKGCY